MKYPVIACFIFCTAFISYPRAIQTSPSPLADYSSAWNDVKYSACNTAATIKYMSASEKEVIYILNMARMNPELFAKTVVKQYPDKAGQQYLSRNKYYKSLLGSMSSMKMINLLYPDSACYVSASCHAISAGQSSYIGHDRKTKDCRQKEYYSGECCDYGRDKPIDIVMSLLIDEGVSSLGHRKICLGNYKKLAVSIQPHKKYRTNAVLDFAY